MKKYLTLAVVKTDTQQMFFLSEDSGVARTLWYVPYLNVRVQLLTRRLNSQAKASTALDWLFVSSSGFLTLHAPDAFRGRFQL